MEALIDEQKKRIASGKDRLHEEIQKVCGNKKLTEDNLSKLPYLGAVFHET
ncbi:hypothetical protein JHK82_017311 [Glycine max]|nr:hypothetical protein JHK82_017311 [Glycine max]